MQIDEYFDLTVEQLHQYRARHQEKDYVLVDVRLPEEYEDEHIPGSLLIPLGDLTNRLKELPPDCDIIFYCNSGRRSRAAALFATSVPFDGKKVYNLLGGILAYHERTVPEFPALETVDLNSSWENLLLSALRLEKCNSEFYAMLLAEIGNNPVRETLEKLVTSEESHARLLYQKWEKEKHNAPPFAELYASLDGSVVEGGRSLDSLLVDLAPVNECSAPSLLEVILDVEFSAYDLYRAIAEKLRNSGNEDTFLYLAQAEKHHMLLAAETLGTEP